MSRSRLRLFRSGTPLLEPDLAIDRLTDWDSFDDSACVLLNNKGEMIGTRVNGIVSNSLRNVASSTGAAGGRWSKILALATKVSLSLRTSALQLREMTLIQGRLYNHSLDPHHSSQHHHASHLHSFFAHPSCPSASSEGIRTHRGIPRRPSDRRCARFGGRDFRLARLTVTFHPVRH